MLARVLSGVLLIGVFAFGLAYLCLNFALIQPEWVAVKETLIQASRENVGALSSDKISFIKQINSSRVIYSLDLYLVFISTLVLLSLSMIIEIKMKGRFHKWMLLYLVIPFFVLFKNRIHSDYNYHWLLEITKSEHLYLELLADVKKNGSPSDITAVKKTAPKFMRAISEQDFERALKAQKI